MITTILQLFIYLIIFDIVLSYIPQVKAQSWAQKLHKIADAPQAPIRDMLPQGMPIDPSPMILIILIQILMYVLS